MDKKRVIRLNEEQVYTIKVTEPKTSLRVVMTYHDEANDATTQSLVVDLNMYVLLPNGTAVYGNMRPDNMEEHFSTAEKVLLYPEELEQGTYEIHVCSGSGISEISNKKAHFSLVAVGPIDGTVPFEPTTKTMEECLNDTFGVRCHLKAINLTGEAQTVTVYPNSAQYFRIEPRAEKYDNITVVFQRPSTVKTGMKFQFAHDYQRSDQHSYYAFVDSSASTVHILLRASFVGSAKFVSMMATNIGPHEFNASYSIVYDRYSKVDPTPTASEIPKTYFVPMVVGWVLFSVALTGLFVVGGFILWGDRCIGKRKDHRIKLKDINDEIVP